MVRLVITAKMGKIVVGQVKREGVLVSGGTCRIEDFKVPPSELKMHSQVFEMAANEGVEFVALPYVKSTD